ncbi:uncharacterized protein TRIVIDRAFT_216138 [Trichoderma virens Gv29-8]|uniref:DUF1857-domain-containing protein n=1 Tax=Hypocrea virens (strain Gv29-8 / FGSC 10586) TaxID=413071 RepID=G9MTV6_HYPVG|nr:uncharacterized protein TRIVIDRAFT_216138 [Trichoderma virens Gv29-8]EHK22125.1 hypothetical protein TRIVIDRAFT_216138 [Trichoderma virens Gv29-8]UKZ45814.1 hypothetical protein TrVGV298_000007 [Trichoderma virens]UKZ72376.1 hypothetical protein TrVFT333_000005 [Trichoderma virens FT-333]
MDSNITFTYNISFTAPANKPTDETKLTSADLWLGVAHVARTPQEFAPYVAKCDVLWETKNKQRLGRAVTLGDGGVHTVNSQVLYQEVSIADKLHVAATTLDTGAKTTFLVSYQPNAVVSPDSTDVSFTVIYELKLAGVQPGSDKAKEIERDYPELARKACVDTIEQIRESKVDGRMAVWAKASQ